MTDFDELIPAWPDWRISDVAFGGRRLDRPGPSGGYRVPERVVASNGRIEYWYTYSDPDEPIGVVRNAREDRASSPRDPASPSGYTPASGRHLAEFIALRPRSEAAIVAYARQWGVLGICERHGLPRTHSAGLSTLCAPLGHDAIVDGGWEPTAAWRFFRRQAFLLLDVRARLHRRERVDQGTWLELFDDDGPRLAYDRAIDFTDPGAPRVSQPLDLRTGQILTRSPVLYWELEEDDWDRPVWECDLRVQCWCAGLVIQSWLNVGRPEMFASWRGDRADVWVGARSLFGVLAMQLAYAASGSPGFDICHECRALFLPKRRAKAGQRTYCAECRADKVPRRDAARDYRERLGAKPRAGR